MLDCGSDYLSEANLIVIDDPLQPPPPPHKKPEEGAQACESTCYMHV